MPILSAVGDPAIAAWLPQQATERTVGLDERIPIEDNREALGDRLEHLGLMYGVDHEGNIARNSHRFHMASALVQVMRIGDDAIDEAVARYTASLLPGQPAIDRQQLDFDTLQLLIDRGFYKPDSERAELLNKASSLYVSALASLRQARQAEASHHPAQAQSATRDALHSHDALWALQTDFAEDQGWWLHLVEGALDVSHTVLDKGSKLALAVSVPVIAALTIPGLIAAGGWLGAAKGIAGITCLGVGISSGQQVAERAAGAKVDPSNAGTRTWDDGRQALQIALGAGVPVGTMVGMTRAAASESPLLARMGTWALERYLGQGVAGLATGATSEVVDHVAAKAAHRQGEPEPELSGLAVAVNAVGAAVGNMAGARIGRAQFKPVLKASIVIVRRMVNTTVDSATGLGQNLALGRSLQDNLPMLATTFAMNFASSGHHAHAHIPQEKPSTHFGGVHVEEVHARPSLVLLEDARAAQIELRKVLQAHADEPASADQDGPAERAIARSLAPVLHRIDQMAEAGMPKPPQAAARELFDQFGSPGEAYHRQYGREIFGKNVAGVSNRMAAVLVDLTLNPLSSINAEGAANAEHLASVFDGALRTHCQKVGRPLTQSEVDWIALQTVLTDITGKGRTPMELRGMKTAPVIDDQGNLVGDNGGAVWEHIVASHPAYASQTALAGELLHGIPSFEIIRDAVIKAGYSHTDAQNMYAGVLGHHMTGFIANGFAKGKITVDFDALTRPDPLTGLAALTRRDAAALKTLYREAIDLHGQWRDKSDAFCAERGALPLLLRFHYARDAYKLKQAISALPEHIRSQLINDDVQQFTPLGIEKWFVIGMRLVPEGATNAQLLHWEYRGPVQAYHEQALALDYGKQFQQRTATTATRLGMIFDLGSVERGSHFRPVEPSDGPAYALFAKHLESNAPLLNEFHERASPGVDIVQWFRGSTADPATLTALARTPMPR